ncbi:MAG: UDP-N-acetylglucosamine 2-epimerase [Deltaproteobacteria bacterium]|nr:UDP-N-acetylglucosamine 2-epimerase [Deltaproteobacteria bacterium]
MIDALVANLVKAGENDILERIGLKQADFIYVTLHRPSNVDAPDTLAAIMRELFTVAGRLPVVFPTHPRTKYMLSDNNIVVDKHNGLRLLDPIGYHESLRLTQQSRLVLTDSGGLQEESTFLQVPCLTLRPNTERPITIEQGTNKLTCIDNLTTDIEEILQNRRMHCRVPEFWDGHTAERIIAALLEI